MSKVVIAIHGLKNKPPKRLMIKWGRKAIEEGIENTGVNIQIPAFEVVYWADVLYDKPLDPEIKNKKSPYFIDELYTESPKNFKVESHEIRKKMLNKIKKLLNKILLKENYDLRYGFVCQKLLHNYFHELEIYFTGNCDTLTSKNCEEKQAIINRLTSVLEKHSKDEIMLVAHSMGTIIAFDVLSFIAKETHINTFVTVGSPLGLPSVISKIASQSRKMNHGHLKLQTPESVLKHWYNISDIEDKIALDYKLADNFTANNLGVKVIDKLVTNNYVMNGVGNPHKSFGYLRTPEFIQVLSEFLNEKTPENYIEQ